MNRLLELLVDLWMFGAPVVLMVWALLSLSRRAPARVRYFVAIAGLLASLGLPLLASFLGRNPIPIPRPEVRERVPLGQSSPEPLVRREAVAWLSPLLAFAWGGGALLLLVRDVLGHRRLRRIRLDARPAPESLRRDLLWPDSVPLLVGDCTSPYTLGLVHPAVLLPTDLASRFPMTVVARMARHELSHARWRDPLFHALLRTLAAFFWVTPVWLVLGWVRREREVAADESALAGTKGEEVQYIELLLHLSHDPAARARRLATAVAATDLEYRARCILEPRKWQTSLTASLVFVTGAALASLPAPATVDQRAETPSLIAIEAPVVDAARRVSAQSEKRVLVNDPAAGDLRDVSTNVARLVGAQVRSVVDVQKRGLGGESLTADAEVDRRFERDRVVRVVVRDTDDMPSPRLRAFLNRIGESLRARPPTQS